MTRSPLESRRIVITGAAGGIGTAARSALVEAGARVVGIDLRAGTGVVAGDVTDAASIRSALAQAVQELGGLDVLVNNAGIGEPQDAGAPPDDTARRIMEVNFWGAWQVTAAALPHLLATRGQVVNVASMLARVDLPSATAYAASKRALDAWSAALRLEYGDRLAVTVIHPGYIRTPIHDRSHELGASLEGMARAERVEDAAAGIVRAIARRPRELRLTPRSELEHAVARHAPALVERTVRRRAERARQMRPAPGFLRPDVEGRP